MSGGEDRVVKDEINLLQERGHHVELIEKTNSSISGILDKIKIATSLTYSKKSKNYLFSKLSNTNFDIVHVHNFFPIFTPSIYDACMELDIPVVQTLHNYRTICPGALLMRGGKICENCITNTPYQAFLNRCYRNSFSGSLVVARMVSYHRKYKTWNNKVDRFISLTEFGKEKFVEAGFPTKKIIVKPNFFRDKSTSEASIREEREGVLFVGRLSEEKGVKTLLDAWQSLDAQLRIAGNGPLFPEYQLKHKNNINFLGSLSSENVSKEMLKANFLVMPSKCYEGFPLVLVESFAHSLPVVASRLGAMAEIIEDGKTGLLFEPGDAEDLAEKVNWMLANPEKCRKMGQRARSVYDEKYTAERNYEMIIKIYHEVIDAYKKN